MTQIQNIKNKLIDRIMASKNEALLFSIYGIFSSLDSDSDLITFSEEQTAMIKLAENDIALGNFISQENLDEKDKEWL